MSSVESRGEVLERLIDQIAEIVVETVAERLADRVAQLVEDRLDAAKAPTKAPVTEAKAPATLPAKKEAPAKAPVTEAEAPATPPAKKEAPAELLKQVSELLMLGKAKEVKEMVEAALSAGVAPADILNKGLLLGMGTIGARFRKNEVYVPEVLIAARAMKAGMEVLQPQLARAGVEPVGTAVIGTVKGDLHDIGKNLVGMMLEGAGFKVVDLGIDVEPAKFVEGARESKALVIGVSALLTTTMTNMKAVIDAVKASDLAGKVKVIVGGAPVTQAFCDEIGADGYAPDAASAADLAKAAIEEAAQAPTSEAKAPATPLAKNEAPADILKQMSELLMRGKAKEVREMVEAALSAGVAPVDILNKGLLSGMGIIGARFKKNEVYVPEVLIAARAMKAGMEVLQPQLARAGVEPVGTAVIGTVKGDLHDIGKNLVGMMLEGAGFKVVDLGIDVEPAKFIEGARESKALVIGVSALLTTTMTNMKAVIDAVKASDLAGKVKVIVGGAPVTQAFCDEIGADGYAPDAASAADLAKAAITASVRTASKTKAAPKRVAKT